MEDEKMPFDRTPGEKDGDRSVESVVKDPPHQADRRSDPKGVGMATESIGIDVQRIVEDFDAQNQDEQDDDHMIV